MRILPSLLLLAFPACSWLAFACLRDSSSHGASAPSISRIQEQDGRRPPGPVPPERPLTGHARRGRSLPARVLSQPFRWNGDPIGPFHLAPDREAARLHSLARRAGLRSFEGAPPLMPHSANFGEGSKVCLDCHRDGMQIGDRVAHPASHSPLPNCTQCHVESLQRDLPAPRTPHSEFDGWRGPAVQEDVRPGAPPTIPHTVRLRNRCLSCHGEFGWPGLRTAHPERAMCMQCHVQERGQ